MDGRAQLRRPPLKRPGAAAYSRTPLRSRVFSHASGISQRKRVKFADMEKAYQESNIKQSLPLSTERIHAPNANTVDEVKTLEYRSFKRLREEIGRGLNHNLLHKKDDNLKTFQTSDCIEELRSMNSWSSDVCKSPLVQEMTPRRFHPTPKSPLKFDNREGGLFSSKRESILQFASTALSKDIKDLKSDRLNLIPKFLQRLGIKGKSSNLDAKSLHQKSNDMHQLPTSFKSNCQHEYEHEIRGMELLPANSKEPRGEYLFPCDHGQIDKFILPLRETVAAEAFSPSPMFHSRHLLVSSWSDGHAEHLHETQTIFESPAFAPRQHASETEQMQSNCVSDIRRISYPSLLHNNSIDFEGLNVEFEGRKHQTKFTSQSLNNFGMEQALAPYISPTSLEVSSLLLTPYLHSNPERKQCTLLLGWRDDDVEAEAGLSTASNRLLRFESDHLALVPCTSPTFLHQTPAFDNLDQDQDGLCSSSDIRIKSWEMDFDRAWHSPTSF